MRHLDPDLLLMVLAGHLPARTLLQVMYEHLKELCPECRANLELVAQELDWTRLEDSAGAADAAGERSGARPPAACCGSSAEPAPDAAESLYGEAFRRAESSTLSSSHRILDERARALRDLEELLRMPVGKRRERVERARSRFRSRWLAELLVDQCLPAVRRDPDDALDLAQLVPAVLRRVPGSLSERWGEELYARALAHRANALRVRGDRASADQVFFELHRFLAARSLESGDLHPELLSLEASLRDNQYRLTEALELLDRAVAAAQQLGDLKELARYRVQRSGVRRIDGDLAGAREDQLAALELLDPDEDTHLFLCTVCSYSLSLCSSGDFHEAAAVLDEHRDLIRRHDEPWLDLQVRHHRGLIDRGLGNLERAEERFLEASRLFAEHRKPCEAAIVCLELAEMYLEQGRHGDLANLAGAMAHIFDTAGVESELLVAVALFQRAVAAEELNREMVDRLRHTLERTAARPAREVHSPS